jgi:mannosylglucosylglycerate synthase
VARVAILHYSAPPVVGGVERILSRHTGLLLEAGHEVHVVVGRGESPDARARLLTFPLLDSLEPTIMALRADLDEGRVPDAFDGVAAVLTGWLREALAGADVVIAHNVCSLHFNLPLTAALHDLLLDGALPNLVSWHHDLAWTMERHRAALHEGYPWDLLRQPWPGARHVTISRTRCLELAGLLGLDPGDITYVPNGMDLENDLALADETIALVRRTDLLAADPLLLMPARLTMRKNVELGLAVVAELRAAGQPAGIVVTGPVDPHDPAQQAYLDRLRRLRSELALEDAAWLLGADTGSAPSDRLVVDLYKVADVLFLPSREEGFGLPVLEAALHRLPIVCSDIPVLREVAGDAALYVAPDGDPAVVAADLLRWLDRDPESRLWRRVRREYDWPRLYRERIEPLVAASPRRASAGRGRSTGA